MDNAEKLRAYNAWAKAALRDPRMRGLGLSEDMMRKWDMAARETGQIGPDYGYGLSDIDSRGHFGDVGKMPWHPTYSDQSKITVAPELMGHWNREGTSFTPSPVKWRDPEYRKYLLEYLKFAGDNNVTVKKPK
jgi:hypothetical protein